VLLNRMRDSGKFGDVQNKLVYIAPLFLEELHVLAVADIHNIRDLDGKTVNLGQKGTAGAVLGHEILDRLDVKVTELNVDLDAALDGMRNGQISATLLVSGKPVRSLMTYTQAEGLHFIAIPYPPVLQEDYLPSALKHEDYPNLISAGDSIDTISVSSVLMAYNWPPGSEGFDLLTSFVQTLASVLPALQTGPHHPKWREVNLAATLPGWARLTSARRNEGESTEEVTRFGRHHHNRHHHHGHNLAAISPGWRKYAPPEGWNERKRTEVEFHTHAKCFRNRCEKHGSHHAWAHRSR
jgi:hypothetical protein